MTKQIYVTKRNGKKEALMIDKIHQVVEWACNDIKDVSQSEVVINSELKFYDKMDTSDIHQSLINTAEELISEEHPNYDQVASRLYNFDLRKKIFGDFLPPEGDEFVALFRSYVDKGIYSRDFDAIDDETVKACWSLVKHDNDYAITTYGMKQITSKYCAQSRTTGQIFETPTMAFFRIALIGALNKSSEHITKNFKEYYKQFAEGENSLPTPIMGGVGTPVKQFSSCTGIDAGDDLDSITSAATAVVKYASQRAGIGLNVGRIRAIGEPVRGGEVSHTGMVPFIQMYQGAVHSVSQGGLRKTAATLYFPLWHYEFPEMVILKDNTLIEEKSARHLDYGVTVNGYLYKRLLEGKDISLFSPSVANGELYETFASDQERFAELYEELENNHAIRRRTLSATEVFTQLLMTQRKETGRIYIVNIDHVNQYGSFNPAVAPVHFSNLCVAPDTIIQVMVDDEAYEMEIKDINLVDEDYFVKSYNIDSREIEWKRIIDFAKTGTDRELVEIKFQHSDKSLRCTPDHKIYTPHRGYVEAQELNPDDIVIFDDGSHGVVVVSKLEETSDVYDITVEDNHNFFADGVLVHNCLEITLPSKPMKSVDDYLDSEIFLCTLANINMVKIHSNKDMERVCYNTVRFLDDLLDYQNYPVKASEYWAKRRRSLGIGVNNYAYWLAKQGYKYGDKEGLEKTHEFFESMQYYLIKASMEIAKEKGVCESFDETDYSKGIMPVDNYKKEVDELGDFEYKMDWDWLREQVLEHGMRNSTLTAQPPSETSSTILPRGATNGIEPVRSAITTKSNRDVSGKVLVPEVRKLKNKYDYLWDQETPIGYIKSVAVIQKFFDQAISANTSYNPNNFPEGNIPMSILMKDILSGYRWGVKTWYYQNTNKQSSTQREDNESELRSSSPYYAEEEEDDCDACKI